LPYHPATVTERIAGLSLEHAIPSSTAVGSVLFVHGMWGGSWYLRNYLDAAAQAGWEAWAVDLRGHGDSPAEDGLGGVGLLDYVDDVRRCLEHLGEVVLVGHSMGGLIAQKTVEAGGVAAAVFVTSAPPRGILSVSWPVATRLARYVPDMVTGRAFRGRRADADVLFLNGLDPEGRDRFFPLFGEESGRAARELALGGLSVDAAAVRCPTLVVGAEHDRITPVRVQRRIAKRYGAEYREAQGHAHMLMLERGWEEPFREILDWMRPFKT
jgi:pimeloyl-ACP methyl ester carboxylesterase